MAYHIKDSDTDRIIRELAKVTGKPILNAIRDACEKELRREVAKVPLFFARIGAREWTPKPQVWQKGTLN